MVDAVRWLKEQALVYFPGAEFVPERTQIGVDAEAILDDLYASNIDGSIEWLGMVVSTCRSRALLWTTAALAVLLPAQLLFARDGIEELLRETYWGESSSELLDQFGDEARRLPRGLDFGDSYANIVLTRQTLGGVPMVVFFQMDKATHGLKRIGRVTLLTRPPSAQ